VVATGVAPSEVDAQMVQFKSGTADIIAYQARPKNAAGLLTAVIVIHENMGLTDHIKDVTRRVAKEGMIGLGIDLLSRDGGTMAFNNPQDATTAIGKLPDAQMMNDITAAVTYLKGSGVNAPKVGIVGFCFGGAVVLKAAEQAKGLDAAVSYYGPTTSNQPDRINPLAGAASITCPLMGNYGALDPANPVTAVQAFAQAAMASGKPVDFKIFDGAGHAFNNDTRPFSNGFGYVAPVATEAWARTLGWFKKYLAS
jgi:carboxymethylenebutenolidase